MDIDGFDQLQPVLRPDSSEQPENAKPLVVPRVLVDFEVIATNGRAARVQRESATSGDEEHLIVRTHPWPFGRKRAIPASAVKRISYGARQVFVQMTKTQVRNAPQWFSRGALASSDNWGGHAGHETRQDYEGLLRR
jgi:hypothetical protein